VSDAKKIINGLEFDREAYAEQVMSIRCVAAPSIGIYLNRECAEHIAQAFGIVQVGEVAADVYSEDVAGLKNDVRQAEAAYERSQEQLRKAREEIEGFARSEHELFGRIRQLEMELGRYKNQTAVAECELKKAKEDAGSAFSEVRQCSLLLSNLGIDPPGDSLVGRVSRLIDDRGILREALSLAGASYNERCKEIDSLVENLANARHEVSRLVAELEAVQAGRGTGGD
jgi:chromosome segregation ATPase